MKKNEKIVLVVGGLAAVGLLIYFGTKNSTPPRLVVVQQPNSLTNTVNQGVSAANALTPIVSDLFNNIFGDNNSGATTSNTTDVSTSLIPSTYDQVSDYDGSVMSGIEHAGTIQ